MTTQEILTKELSRLRRFAYSLTCDKAEADDLLHDLVVKVLEKGLPKRQNHVPWLFTVCKNLWLDGKRHEKVKKRYIEGEEHLAEEARMESLESSIVIDQVMARLRRLPEEHRLALSLVAIEGLGYAEASEVLNVPVGTVMSRVCRARMQLKQSYKEDYKEALV